MVKVRRSSSAGSASVRMAAMTSRGLAGPSDPLALASRARAPKGEPGTWVSEAARASHLPHAEVAVIGGNHGGFDRIDALNDRMAAFIEAQAAGQPG
jgi:hypothetical protein